MDLKADDIRWGVIRADYITGDESYRKLAERYGVPLGTIQRRCMVEGWKKMRDQYRADVVAGLLQKHTEEDIRHLDDLRTAASSMAVVLKDITEKVAEIAGDGGINRAKTGAAKDVVTAIKDLTSAMRDLYGIPNTEDAARIRIAEERLELERQRLEQGDDASVVRVILDGLEDYAK